MQLFFIIEIENVKFIKCTDSTEYLYIAFCRTELDRVETCILIVFYMPNQLYSCIVLPKLLKYYSHTKGQNLHGMPAYFMALLAEYQADLCQRVLGFPAHVWLKPQSKEV